MRIIITSQPRHTECTLLPWKQQIHKLVGNISLKVSARIKQALRSCVPSKVKRWAWKRLEFILSLGKWLPESWSLPRIQNFLAFHFIIIIIIHLLKNYYNLLSFVFFSLYETPLSCPRFQVGNRNSRSNTKGFK